MATSRAKFPGVALAASAMLLGSCGGGGSSPTPTPSPPPVSTAPSFTSSTAVSVAENNADTFYTATATDPQNDAISFSVVSGADAGSFVVAADGALRFDTAPNFDLPTDANGDNIYLVNLRAAAGGETVQLALQVTVTNEREGVSVSRVVSGLANPVDFSFVHNEPTLLIAEASGRVLEFDPTTGALTENTYIRDNKLPGEILAIANGFPDRNFQAGIYIITHDPQDGLFLQAFDADKEAKGFARLGDPWTGPVSASLIAQNSVYAAIGDPGGALAQSSSSAYGKLHEFGLFDVFSGASVPPPGAIIIRPQIIGDGIQMPGGFSPASDFLYLADQGTTIEHGLTIFRRNQRPLDFGWPFYEASKEVRSDPPAAVNGPTIAYAVGQGEKEGTGIVAGLLNDARFFEALGNTYVFADESGKIWTIPVPTLLDGFLHFADDIELRTEDFAPDVGTIDSPIAFANGFGTSHFYILDADGEIFKVEGVE